VEQGSTDGLIPEARASSEGWAITLRLTGNEKGACHSPLCIQAEVDSLRLLMLLSEATSPESGEVGYAWVCICERLLAPQAGEEDLHSRCKGS
jgi:hypothetical protein